MHVACPGCHRPIAVPADKQGVPGLKARCRCGTVFAVADAVVPRAPQPFTTAPPVPKPPAVGPAPVRAAAAPATASAVQPAATKPRRVHWRRCQQHPQVASAFVCTACSSGWCAECVKSVQGAAVCTGCDSLCVSAAERSEKEAVAAQRERSLFSDLGLVAAYPFRDPLGLALLAVFVFAFGYVHAGLAHAVLIWYSFHALTKVSNGNLRDFMPDFTDVADLYRPARLAFAAFLVSTAPVVLVIALVPGARLPWERAAAEPVPAVEAPQPAPADGGGVTAEELVSELSEDAEGGAAAASEAPASRDTPARETPLQEEPASGLALVLLAVAGLWKLVYTPVAMTVGALSRSLLSTINPVIGIGTIGRMGVVYWQAMAVYTAVALVQWMAARALDGIPIAGSALRSAVDAYAYLAIGCVLGLAVFKKAKELGWD